MTSESQLIPSLLWVLQESRRLADVVSSLDLPGDDQLYLRGILDRIEQEASQLFAAWASPHGQH